MAFFLSMRKKAKNVENYQIERTIGTRKLINLSIDYK
jgi:hypothetical protein